MPGYSACIHTHTHVHTHKQVLYQSLSHDPKGVFGMLGSVVLCLQAWRTLQDSITSGEDILESLSDSLTRAYKRRSSGVCVCTCVSMRDR